MAVVLEIEDLNWNVLGNSAVERILLDGVLSITPRYDDRMNPALNFDRCARHVPWSEPTVERRRVDVRTEFYPCFAVHTYLPSNLELIYCDSRERYTIKAQSTSWFVSIIEPSFSLLIKHNHVWRRVQRIWRRSRRGGGHWPLKQVRVILLGLFHLCICCSTWHGIYICT